MMEFWTQVILASWVNKHSRQDYIRTSPATTEAGEDRFAGVSKMIGNLAQ